jgi:hypothetical protein
MLDKYEMRKSARHENEGWLETDVLIEQGGKVFSVNSGGAVFMIGSFKDARTPKGKPIPIRWALAKKPDLWSSGVYMGETVYEH